MADEPATVGAAESVPAAANAPGSPAQATSRSWLSNNRLKLALGIALVEGIFVFLEDTVSRWTVIAIAIPVILFYLLAGRTLASRLGREISWVLAMSQALAVVAAIIAITIPVVALVLAGAFAVVALYLLFHDRPDRGGSAAPPAE